MREFKEDQNNGVIYLVNGSEDSIILRCQFFYIDLQIQYSPSQNPSRLFGQKLTSDSKMYMEKQKTQNTRNSFGKIKKKLHELNKDFIYLNNQDNRYWPEDRHRYQWNRKQNTEIYRSLQSLHTIYKNKMDCRLKNKTYNYKTFTRNHRIKSL